MRIVALLLLAFITSSLLAQNTINGKIVDADSGEGLIGAHVYLLKDWRNGTTTSVDGSFSLTISSKQDSLVVTYIGFEEIILPLASDMLVKLKPIQIEGIEVVITAKPLIAEEFKYQKIRKIEIYTNPAAKADPILAVNALPSSTTTDESANISLRGSSPIETSIFLNNVPVYDAVRYAQLNGIGTFSIFNTSIVKELTVFPGNPPLEFGNTTAGIISLTTDDQILDDNANSIAISLANIGVTREQKISKNQSLKLFSNWQPSGAIKALNETSLNQIKSFNSADFGIYWYGSGKQMNWKILSYTVFEGYKFNFRHPSFTGIFNQNKKRTFLVSTVERSVGQGRLSLNNGVSSSLGKYAFSNVKFEVDQSDFFGGLNYMISNAKWSFKSGMSYDLRSSGVEGNFHEISYALNQNHPTISVSESTRITTLEGFTYFKYYLSDKVTVGSGLRKNIPDGDQNSYLSKQINMAFTSLPWSVTIGTGTYHKNGLLENTGTPFNSSSKQVSGDVKYEGSRYQIAFSLFSKKNEINASKYSAKGAEFFADYALTDKFMASTSITWLNANNESEESYTYDLNFFVRGNLSYSPGRFWTIEGTLVARQGSLYSPVIGASFENDLDVYQPMYGGEDLRLPNYSNVGLSISKMFPVSETFNVIAFASLNNVTDRKNIRSFDYNFDYTSSQSSFFSRRTGYFGAVISF